MDSYIQKMAFFHLVLYKIIQFQNRLRREWYFLLG